MPRVISVGPPDAASRELTEGTTAAGLAKIPYVLFVGDQDVAPGSVGVNRRGWPETPERGVPVDAFVAEVVDEVGRKGLPEDRAPTAA